MKYFTIAELCKSDTADQLGIDNRCKKEHVVNKAVKGSATSDHMTGRAADITGGSPAENKKLFYMIQSLGLPFDQLIDEKNFAWVHVSYREGANRKQVLAL